MIDIYMTVMPDKSTCSSMLVMLSIYVMACNNASTIPDLVNHSCQPGDYLLRRAWLVWNYRDTVDYFIDDFVIN